MTSMILGDVIVIILVLLSVVFLAQATRLTVSKDDPTDASFNLLQEITFTDTDGSTVRHSGLTMSRGCGRPDCKLCAWRDAP